MALNISPLVQFNHAWQQRTQDSHFIAGKAAHIRELKFLAVKNSDQ
jgi:hypothetical protein